MSDPVFIDGIGAIAERFDAFLLDQFGVMHDGTRAYPHAVEALRELQRLGKRLFVLSNSGQRVPPNRERLGRVGLPMDAFEAIVTSGEVAWQVLKARRTPPYDRLGRRCLLLNRDDDRRPVEGLDLDVITEPGAADFILMVNTASPGHTLEDYRAVLAPMLERQTPMICSNPDRVAVSSEGLAIAAGAVAAWYEEEGGRVHRIGKPYPEIYAHCLRHLEGVDKTRVAAVGDSFEHDIRGGRAAGLATVFVRDGIHGPELSGAGPDALLRLAAAHGAPAPDFVCPAFRY